MNLKIMSNYLSFLILLSFSVSLKSQAIDFQINWNVGDEVVVEYEITNIEIDGEIEQPPEILKYSNRILVTEKLEKGFRVVFTVDHPVRREFRKYEHYIDMPWELIEEWFPGLEIELLLDRNNGEFEVLNTDELATEMESFLDRLGLRMEEESPLFKMLFDLTGPSDIEGLALAEEIIEMVEDDMMYLLLPFRYTFQLDRPVTVVEKEQNPLDYSTVSVKTARYRIKPTKNRGFYEIQEETEVDLSAFTETMTQMKSFMQDGEDDDPDGEKFKVEAGFDSGGTTIFDSMTGWVKSVDVETHIFIRSQLMGDFENRTHLQIRVKKQ